MTRSLFILLAIFCQYNLSAQITNDTKPTEQDLAFYADVTINADNPNHRLRANDYFYKEFKVFLEEEGSFDNSLEALQWISIQYAPDRSFRLISWQLAGPDHGYEYFGFYQDQHQLIELKSSVEFSQSLDREKITAESWYGQLIYEILPIDNYYLLFGFRQLDQFTKTKVVKVLDFKDGKPNFDRAVFKNKDSEQLSLLAIAYSADITATMNYNPGLNMIVQDHLIQRMGRMPGQGPTFLPDGTYEAYKKEGNVWVYVEQLYNEIIEKPTDRKKNN